MLLQVYTGTGAGSGLNIAQRNGQVYTLRKGWVIRLQDYWDWDEALEAVGLGE